jgi:carbon storage regulator
MDFTTKEGNAMSHLILTRRVGQSIVLSVATGADPEQALHQLLRDGITGEINRVEQDNVRVSIDVLGDRGGMMWFTLGATNGLECYNQAHDKGEVQSLSA